MNKKSPQNTILAWDFHDVVAYKPLGTMAVRGLSLIKNADNRWQLAKLLFSPTFWSTVSSTGHATNSGDRIIEKMIEKYPELLAHHRDEIYEIANLHQIDQEVMDIIKQLRELGYKQVLASNIGPESLGRMRKKYPELFALFDELYFDGSVDKKGVRYTQLVKPHTAYYEGLRNFLDDHGITQPQIIFIDDKKENITGARQSNVGIDGIRFLNATQLRKMLKKKGIVVKKWVVRATKNTKEKFA